MREREREKKKKKRTPTFASFIQTFVLAFCQCIMPFIASSHDALTSSILLFFLLSTVHTTQLIHRHILFLFLLMNGDVGRVA
jgi:uncharacterized membrane protein